MNDPIYNAVDIGQGKVIMFETGRLAKQAGGSVVIRQGDTMVLCTAVVAPDAREGQHFFPLTVDYREKFSAGGKIPGGFFKREGRPSDKEVLSSRLVDRAIRPLFPDGFRNEVQVLLTVFSADPEVDADVLGGCGGSAALLMTGAPFAGPISEVRVGRVDGELVLNPTFSELENSDIDLVVAGKQDAIMMVEGELNEVPEQDVLDALEFAHEAIRKICQAQLELKKKFEEARGEIKPMEYTTVATPAHIIAKADELVGADLAEHIRKPYNKEDFYGGVRDIKNGVIAKALGLSDDADEAAMAEAMSQFEEENEFSANELRGAVGEVEKQRMREMIVKDGQRIDGRDTTEVRPIWIENGYLPRVHGSSIFTRGETQVLASVTLGTNRDTQAVDNVYQSEEKTFFLHYNFPPYSTGEAKFLRGPGRREVGHGYLAERALKSMLPSQDDFPYVVRLLCEVLESNGSSSMASVCSGSLAMMDAGVPLKKPVAGIAMGLIKEGDDTVILSDILGTEDHLGDMDFKVTGTEDGITAVQMDIKIDGISRDTMAAAMEQAREGRLHILGVMNEVLSEARTEMSPYAPRLTQMIIDADFIGAVIGPGGKIIQGMQKETNTQINIEEKEGKGFITVAATSAEDAEAAVTLIKQIVSVPEVGEQYEGTVRVVKDFGAIVEVLPGKEGLLHVSEMEYGYVDNPGDLFQVGDKVKVELIEVRDDGKLRLSRKPFLTPPEGGADNSERRGGGDRDRGDRRGGGGRGGDRRGGRGRR